VPESNLDEGAVMVLGRVIGIHIRDDVIVNGLVDVTRMKPIARLGYFNYASVENVFSIEFPD
jgi:flavin reductase (DIM6/NTAB) family NADH-FMN oxidoreductase RutF